MTLRMIMSLRQALRIKNRLWAHILPGQGGKVGLESLQGRALDVEQGRTTPKTSQSPLNPKLSNLLWRKDGNLQK